MIARAPKQPYKPKLTDPTRQKPIQIYFNPNVS